MIQTNKWHDLGVQLGIEDKDSNQETVLSYNYITTECRREMFSLWLNTTSKHRVVERTLRYPENETCS